LAIMRMARERIVGVRKPDPAKLADIEYRVVRNEATKEWTVFRNGVETNISARKKKTSAVDSAVREAKTELENSGVVIVVISVEGRRIETVWRAP
jgi:hypothetical protein